MLIATDPLSLVFVACFLFGLLFLIGSALLGNLGHGGGSHAASHQFNLHVGGQAGTAHTAGFGKSNDLLGFKDLDLCWAKDAAPALKNDAKRGSLFLVFYGTILGL